MASVPNPEKFMTPELLEKSAQMKKERGLPTLGYYDDLMAYPELFTRIEAVGSYLRFDSALAPLVREAEILMVATELRSAFEAETHQKTAAAAGVTPALFEAIASEASLVSFGNGLEDVREAMRCTLGQRSVPQDCFDRLIDAHGVPGAVEVVALAAFYRMNASLAAAFDSVLPGAPAPPWA